ncbi:MAG: hypothetical protein VX294_02305 [Candidatus Latescibacterota bacterium]|nr:hypothetical protein [Candidatus Latescibacterota bacterium]
MDMRTEAARFAPEAIPRTDEKKDRFRSNNENRGGKKRKNDKKRREEADGGIVDLLA